jgi:hypothetical protein
MFASMNDDSRRALGRCCPNTPSSRIDTAYERLTLKGLSADPPKLAPYGLKTFSLKDPDGYTVVFQEVRSGSALLFGQVDRCGEAAVSSYASWQRPNTSDVSRLMRILACSLICLGLGGCAPSEDFMDSLFGIKHNVVVLTSSALDVSQIETSFTPATDAEAVGKESSVCVVLAAGEPGVPWKDTENEANRLLNGAKLSATVTTSDGATHEFQCQGINWSRNGRIVPSNEIAACVQQSCSKQAISVGAKVRSIALSSTAPVHALGVYWNSTAAFDRRGN